jgi:hypothetical protein
MLRNCMEQTFSGGALETIKRSCYVAGCTTVRAKEWIDDVETIYLSPASACIAYLYTSWTSLR